MSDTAPSHAAAAQDRTARDAVVRPLARAAQRACVRPGCPAPARASLSFRYETREAWLERLSEEPRPESYDLCSSHAARTCPPHGWQLRDRRPREEQVDGEPPVTPDHLGGEQTVAVLAAALRSVPDGDEAAPAQAPPSTPPPEADPGAGRLEDTASPVLEPPPTEPAVEPPPTEPAPEPPRPRPVPAARERWRASPGADRASDGPARHW